MHLVYIDDSGDEACIIYTAILVSSHSWHDTYNQIKRFRQRLRDKYKIPISKEIHSTKFVSGRGRISADILTKNIRIEIFNEFLKLISSLDVRIFNSIKHNSKQYIWAFNNLLNRIERTMKEENSKAILISDEGKENILSKLRRKMAIHNPIPSNNSISHVWQDTGTPTKNIPLENIVEDIIFKKSHHSHFIQLADVCAYAFLRYEKPLPSKTKYQLDSSFQIVENVLFKRLALEIH